MPRVHDLSRVGRAPAMDDLLFKVFAWLAIALVALFAGIAAADNKFAIDMGIVVVAALLTACFLGMGYYLGFYTKGVGGPFVASGPIAPDDSLPVNTNGGGLSCCLPGMYGRSAIVEGARQLCGDAATLIDDSRLALAHGNGGTLSSQATVIFGGLGTLLKV